MFDHWELRRGIDGKFYAYRNLAKGIQISPDFNSVAELRAWLNQTFPVIA